MMNIKMIYKAWYGDEEITLPMPSTWHIWIAPMHDAPDIGSERIERAFDNPIGSPTIQEIANGKETAAILVDDLSRPTPTHLLLPPLLSRLEEAGITKDSTRIIVAQGAHRPMIRQDCVKKYGERIVSSYSICNHHPYENLTFLGDGKHGRILVNRFFAEADLKVGIGSVCPHGAAGFSGGAKIVLPGVAGIDTIEANHKPLLRTAGQTTCAGVVEGNETRQEMEELARMSDLQLIINSVITSRRGIAEVFVGDMIQAHRAAVAFAKDVYATKLPDKPADVAILNAYPKDTDLSQSGCVFNVFCESGKQQLLKDGGTLIILSACSEGRGFHSLSDPGMRLYKPFHEHPSYRHFLERYNTILCSPNVNNYDVKAYYPKETVVANSWSAVLSELEKRYENPSVVIFPCAAIQLPVQRHGVE